jgi:hypothetical protein
MINITKNAENTVVFNTSKTSVKQYFVFSLTHQQTDTNILFTSFDVTNNSLLYNTFLVIETGKTYENKFTGHINLQSGWYNYEIKDNDIPNDLSFTGVTVERGLMLVEQTAEERMNVIDDSNRNVNFLDKI